jgi:hypothetical protein
VHRSDPDRGGDEGGTTLSHLHLVDLIGERETGREKQRLGEGEKQREGGEGNIRREGGTAVV